MFRVSAMFVYNFREINSSWFAWDFPSFPSGSPTSQKSLQVPVKQGWSPFMLHCKHYTSDTLVCDIIFPLATSLSGEVGSNGVWEYDVDSPTK